MKVSKLVFGDPIGSRILFTFCFVRIPLVGKVSFLYKEGKNSGLESINQSNLVPTNILESFFILFASCSFFKKGLIAFHFSKKVLSFSKCGSFLKCAFILEMKSFKNVKGFVSVFFLYPKNCKQSFVNKNLFSHYKLLY